MRRVATFSASVVAAGSFLLVLHGCAAILGFDDTSLKTDGGGGGPGVDACCTTGADAGPDAANPTIAISPASVLLRRGGTTNVTVLVDRATTPGPNVLAFADLPTGVTAPDLTIPADASSGTVTMSATAGATLGGTTFRVTGLAEDGKASLLVADRSGSPDVTFDADGVASDTARGSSATYYALAIQTDHRALAGGSATAFPAGWILHRYFENGLVDTAFEASLGTRLPADGEIRGIAVDPGTGMIVMTGSSTGPSAGQPQLTVLRLLANGAPDPSFGATGVVRLGNADAGLGSKGYAVAIAADRSIYVAGVRTEATDETGIVVHWRSDGTRDPAFGAGGVVATVHTHWAGLALDDAGNLTVGGTDTTASSYLLARFSPKGALDATFGSSGKLSFGPTYRAAGFARLADGSFAVVGGDATSNSLYTAGRASAAGAQVWVRAIANGGGASFNAAAPTAGGKFFAVGSTAVADGEARVDRIQPDGAHDPTFGSGGVAIVQSAGTPNGILFYAAATYDDGRVLAAGNRANNGAIVYRLWP